jgi:hypothetical protein
MYMRVIAVANLSLGVAAKTTRTRRCSMCPLIIFGGNAVNWSSKGQTHPAEQNNKSPSGSEKLIGLDKNKSLI